MTHLQILSSPFWHILHYISRRSIIYDIVLCKENVFYVEKVWLKRNQIRASLSKGTNEWAFCNNWDVLLKTHSQLDQNPSLTGGGKCRETDPHGHKHCKRPPQTHLYSKFRSLPVENNKSAQTCSMQLAVSQQHRRRHAFLPWVMN